jgi:hypothetical protein
MYARRNQRSAISSQCPSPPPCSAAHSNASLRLQRNHETPSRVFLRWIEAQPSGVLLRYDESDWTLGRPSTGRAIPAASRLLIPSPTVASAPAFRTINLRLSMPTPTPGPYGCGQTDSGANLALLLVKKPLNQSFQSCFALRQAHF